MEGTADELERYRHEHVRLKPERRDVIKLTNWSIVGLPSEVS
jgi:hypothetical protein